ncbi:MAG: hypothetical protein ACFFCW_30215 [Candidatus Hodarchaeota archaeon]
MKVNSTIKQKTNKPKILFSIVIVIMVLIVVFVTGELLIRILNPQVSLYPRFQFSSKYGFMLFEKCKMIHMRPGKWKFTYTINEFQYRGKLTPISNYYDKENIVILGDSSSFGMGVNDGDEYALIMAHKLKDNYNVINLSLPGSGLAQQIRRYYEFGQLYSPKILLLQFSLTDPIDNFTNMVTIVEKKRFKFQNVEAFHNWAKKYLSKSIIQKSQIYNLVRNAAYQFFARRAQKKTKLIFQKGNIYDDQKIKPEEHFYNELLDLFAKDLNRKGIDVIMISVNGELDFFPNIKEKIFDLDSKGLINYHEVIPWFENIRNYGSLEGHPWGKKGHYIIGAKLSEIIKNRPCPKSTVRSSNN